MPRAPNIYRNAAYLGSCSEVEAANWLSSRSVELSSVMGTPKTPEDSHIIEYILLRRRLPTIDIALAENGRSGTVLQRLYARSNDAVRVIACTNASLFVGDTIGNQWREESLLWKIMYDGPMSEVRAICENPYLPSGVYSAIIESWKPEPERKEQKRYLPEDRYIACINFLASNARIGQSREDSAERNYLDGFAEYEYNKFYTAAWKLAETVPTTPAWANALANLFERLHLPFKCIEDIQSAIARWRPEEEDEYSATRRVRSALASAFYTPSVEMLNDDDAALRIAFYRKFEPDRQEFRDLDWNKWIERDPQIYFDISSNDRVWASRNGRSKLRNMLRHGSREDSDLFTLGLYDEHIEVLEAQHPDWFVEEVSESDFDEPQPDPITQLRREILALTNAMERRRSSSIWTAGALIIGILVGVIVG